MSPVEATYDSRGRLVMPRFAGECNEPTNTKEPHHHVVYPVLRKAVEFLEEMRGEIVAWADDMGCEPDTVLLAMLGFITQDIQTCCQALKRSRSWVEPRVKRMIEMGLWVGGTSLGSRFGAWVDGDHAGMSALLDVMVIDGTLDTSTSEDGECVYSARTNEGCSQ